MASSGQTSLNFDVEEVIQEALERIGGEVAVAAEMRSARRSLNLIFADWANRGHNLWTVDAETLDLVSGTATYTLTAGTIDVLDANSVLSSQQLVMSRMSRQEYAELPDKTLQSDQPSRFYIARLITSVTMTVWPVPNSSTPDVEYYRIRRMDDVTAGAETLDIPHRLMPALTAGLALYMARKRKTPVAPEKMADLKGDYTEALAVAFVEDRERVPVQFGIAGY